MGKSRGLGGGEGAGGSDRGLSEGEPTIVGGDEVVGEDGEVQGMELLLDGLGQGFVLEDAAGKNNLGEGMGLVELVDELGDGGSKAEVKFGGYEAGRDRSLEVLQQGCPEGGRIEFGGPIG